MAFLRQRRARTFDSASASHHGAAARLVGVPEAETDEHAHLPLHTPRTTEQPQACSISRSLMAAPVVQSNLQGAWSESQRQRLTSHATFDSASASHHGAAARARDEPRTFDSASASHHGAAANLLDQSEPHSCSRRAKQTSRCLVGMLAAEADEPRTFDSASASHHGAAASLLKKTDFLPYCTCDSLGSFHQNALRQTAGLHWFCCCMYSCPRQDSSLVRKTTRE